MATKYQTEKDEYKGEPVSDELTNGPMEKRSCTDPLCCLFFVAFMIGMIVIAAYGLSKGNPTLVGRGYDSDGKMCGIDDGYEDYDYLYWPVPKSGYLDKTVCVKTCPDDPLPGYLDCKTNSLYKTCVGTSSRTAVFNYLGGSTNIAADTFLIYNTTGFINRFCIPKQVSTYFNDLTDTVFDSEILEQWVSDIRQTWPILVASLFVALVIGFVYMFILKYCSGVLTWVSIILFIAGLFALGWLFYDKADKMRDENESTGADEKDGSSVKRTIVSLRVIAYVCWAVCALTFLSVLCLFSRIRLAIAIMKAAADYVKDTPSVFLYAPLNAVILILFYGYWGITAVYLVSSGDAEQIEDTPFGTFEFDKKLQRLLIYHVFGLLWFNAFVIASTQFVLASSTCLWYFSQGTGQTAGKTIRKSIYRLIRYHLGSIAFGSLILAIVQMIRLVLAYMQAQARKMAGKEGRTIRFVLACLQCYVACFERFIKFLNKNAYIQIALTGKNFCMAAKDGFFLVLRNPLRFGIVAGIGSVFIFFGKIFIAAITALAGFIAITRWDHFNDGLYSPFIPTIIMFVFAYAIGAIFMSIYGLAADAILACFVVDEELAKRRNAPPRHCPESLKVFLEKNKKA